MVFNTYYNGLMVQPDEIKDLAPGLDAVNDVRYISFKIKGERQPYRISNIATKEDYDFLYSFLSNIPIQGTTEADRLVVIPDEFEDKPTSDKPAPARLIRRAELPEPARAELRWTRAVGPCGGPDDAAKTGGRGRVAGADMGRGKGGGRGEGKAE